MKTVSIVRQAMASLVRDLKANGVKHDILGPARIDVEDSAKGRLALRLVRERFGARSMRILE